MFKYQVTSVRVGFAPPKLRVQVQGLKEHRQRLRWDKNHDPVSSKRYGQGPPYTCIPHGFVNQNTTVDSQRFVSIKNSLFEIDWNCNFLVLLDDCFWLRITDEGSVTEIRILSVFLIKSDLKWCILVEVSICWMSLIVDQIVHEGICSQLKCRFRLIRSVLGASKFSVLKLI